MVLYEKRASRLIHFICLTFTVGLTGLMVYLVFMQDPSRPLYEETAKIEGGAKVFFGFFILIGIFLTGVFGHRLIKNRAYFVITEEGFEYSPGGVSPGLIRWGDIVELREENVLTDRGGIGGPALELTVAVVLRNPEEYMAKYPAAFKPFLAIRGKMNSSPILMRPSDFGRDYQSIMTIMREQVRQHAGRGPAKGS